MPTVALSALSTLAHRVLILAPELTGLNSMEDRGVTHAQTALIAQPAAFGLAGPIGSFDAYLERVSRIPVLSREQEHELALRFRRDDDLSAARELVLSHLRFVVHIARG